MEETVIEQKVLEQPSTDENEMQDTQFVPDFPQLTALAMKSALRTNWAKLIKPIVEQLSLQVRYNQKGNTIDIRTCKSTTLPTAMRKASDYIEAFLLGFEIDDSIALIRLDDIYIESFQVEDIKDLKGDHLSRAIGRIAGQGGKTKFTIENSTKTRIVLSDHNLILGAPPGKVYNQMKSVANRMKERF